MQIWKCLWTKRFWVHKQRFSAMRNIREDNFRKSWADVKVLIVALIFLTSVIPFYCLSFWHINGASLTYLSSYFSHYITRAFSPAQTDNLLEWNVLSTVIFLSFRTDRSGQTVQTKIRVWSESTLFAIPSASFACITLRKRHLVQFLGWLQQIFWVSKYLGNLRYIEQSDSLWRSIRFL